MHEKNAVTKSYLSDPERFAQLFNVSIFQGDPLLKPEKLKELDPASFAFLSSKSSSKKQRFTKDVYRDILKTYEDHALFIICGIENQTNVHYVMPVRHMLYDALQYHQQWQKKKRFHLDQKDLSGDEYLSGFSKEDRLIPVFTLCVYWGTEPWDGPKNLQEMLDIPPKLEQYKDKITNYTLNILEVNSISNLDDYQGELKALLGLLRYQKDKTKLSTFVAQNRELFQSISPETVLAMSVLGNMKTLEQYIPEDNPNDNTTNNDKKGGIDVCQAIEEMIQDGRNEGILIGEKIGKKRGRRQGFKRGEKFGFKRGGIQTLIEDNLEEGISETRILEKLQQRFEMTEEEALTEFNRYSAC